MIFFSEVLDQLVEILVFLHVIVIHIRGRYFYCNHLFVYLLQLNEFLVEDPRRDKRYVRLSQQQPLCRVLAKELREMLNEVGLYRIEFLFLAEFLFQIEGCHQESVEHLLLWRFLSTLV